MLRVAVGVPAGALVLQHQRVVHEAWGRGGGAAVTRARGFLGSCPRRQSAHGTRPMVSVPTTQGWRELSGLQGKGQARQEETRRQAARPRVSGLSAVSRVALTSRGLR